MRMLSEHTPRLRPFLAFESSQGIAGEHPGLGWSGCGTGLGCGRSRSESPLARWVTWAGHRVSACCDDEVEGKWYEKLL